MEVALGCLARYLPVSERLAEALVDGHCEKTLALLWGVIFHFKVPPLILTFCSVHCVCTYYTRTNVLASEAVHA